MFLFYYPGRRVRSLSHVGCSIWKIHFEVGTSYPIYVVHMHCFTRPESCSVVNDTHSFEYSKAKQNISVEITNLYSHLFLRGLKSDVCICSTAESLLFTSHHSSLGQCTKLRRWHQTTPPHVRTQVLMEAEDLKPSVGSLLPPPPPNEPS